jgi:hypothetical protein
VRIGGDVFEMTTMEGVNNSDGRPLPHLFREARRFEERAWTIRGARPKTDARMSNSDGVDVRGWASNDTKWRFVGTMSGSMVIQYTRAHSEAAKVFDAMIDSMCAVHGESPRTK